MTCFFTSAFPATASTMARLFCPIFLPALLSAFLVTGAVPTARGDNGSGCAERTRSIEVRQSRDETTAGWNDELDDQLFQAEDAKCVVRWHALTFKSQPDEISIQMRDECDVGLAERTALHDAVLCRMLSKYPREKLKGFGGGEFDREELWRERLAVASARSADYAKIRDGRNQGLFQQPNELLVKIFNANEVGREFAGLFARHGLRLEMSSVEKVFEEKANTLQFAARHPELRKLKKRVMTGAGSCYFKLQPLAPLD